MQASTTYGCEVDPLTQGQIAQLRAGAATALWGNKGPRNKTAMLLLTGDGKLEPKVEYYFRILKNWHRQIVIGQACNAEVQEYWPVAMNDRGRTKGPLHLVARVLQAADLEAPGPWVWHIPD